MNDKPAKIFRWVWVGMVITTILMMLITAVHMIEYERRLSEINEVTTDVQMIVYELEMIVDQFEPPPQMDFYFDSPPSDQLSPPEEHNQIRAPI